MRTRGERATLVYPTLISREGKFFYDLLTLDYSTWLKKATKVDYQSKPFYIHKEWRSLEHKMRATWFRSVEVGCIYQWEVFLFIVIIKLFLFVLALKQEDCVKWALVRTDSVSPQWLCNMCGVKTSHQGGPCFERMYQVYEHLKPFPVLFFFFFTERTFDPHEDKPFTVGSYTV